MDIKVRPGRASGSIGVPPSKSMAHRQLIGAALAQGSSVIHNLSMSEDISATIDCLRTLGAEVEQEGSDARITGIGGLKGLKGGLFKCRESGSTLRFFIPLALASGQASVFEGSRVLMTRPLSVYEDICREQGLTLRHSGEGRLETEGRLRGGNFRFRGDVSSQFVTGLLFVLPLMEEDSCIELIPPVESRSYILLTLEALRTCGVSAEFEGNVIRIKGRQSYRAGDYTVEGDWSNAAFLEVFNTLKGQVMVSGLREDSLQGDRVYREHFRELEKGSCMIDISDCPDLGPVLFTVAALHKGAVFTGTARLKIKESDRGAVMCEELAKCGVDSLQEEDRIFIGGGLDRGPDQPFDGHNDHRIVMALTTILTVTGGELKGAGAVSKSFPDYFDKLKELGIEVEEYGMDQQK